MTHPASSSKGSSDVARRARRPLILMILDGWGWRAGGEANAIELAHAPNWQRLWDEYPHTLLECSGEAVGLPRGTMGNSEVGHLNIGAGRVVYQDFTRINGAIEDGSFFENEVFAECLHGLKLSSRSLHLMGLCSDVGVHAHIAHLFALMDFAKRSGVKTVFVHAITDGRDSPPDSGLGFIKRLQQRCAEVGNAGIATVMGRYYAMDRDKRWDRTQKAYEAIVEGRGAVVESAEEAVLKSYAAGVTDEFIVPTVICPKPAGSMEDGDAFIFFNFRADRARQITQALTDDNFAGFDRGRRVPRGPFICMTEFDEKFDLPVAFPQVRLTNILAQVLASNGLKQLRLAETEKYAHVTFFFNGGEEKVLPGEDRVLIPSPRDVPTYDLKPEMSAFGITKEALKKIEEDTYDVIILNFANGDMVGHTGELGAAIKAVEAVDASIGQIVPAMLSRGGTILITSDHGNCEEMKDKHGGPMTSHSVNPVPFICIAGDTKGLRLRDGGNLSDIAPTILEILGLDKPAEMTGQSLINHYPPENT